MLKKFKTMGYALIALVIMSMSIVHASGATEMCSKFLSENPSYDMKKEGTSCKISHNKNGIWKWKGKTVSFGTYEAATLPYGIPPYYRATCVNWKPGTDVRIMQCSDSTIPALLPSVLYDCNITYTRCATKGTLHSTMRRFFTDKNEEWSEAMDECKAAYKRCLFFDSKR